MSDVTGIGTAVTGVKDILGMIFPDRTQEDRDKMEQALNLAQMSNDLQKAQIAANTAEASTPGLHFRDGAGWCCVIGFAISELKSPIEWASSLFGHPITLPPVDTAVMQNMLFGLLGLGGLHTYQATRP